MDTVDNYIPTPKRDITSPFLLPIDNCLLVPGRGTVVIGTLKRGTVNKNDRVELIGFDEHITTSVGDIQVFKKSVTSAKAGENVGLLLRGIKPKLVRKGMILCPINTLKLNNCFKATIYFLSRGEGGRSKPIMSNYQQQLFSHTWNIVCRYWLAVFGKLLLKSLWHYITCYIKQNIFKLHFILACYEWTQPSSHKQVCRRYTCVWTLSCIFSKVLRW